MQIENVTEVSMTELAELVAKHLRENHWSYRVAEEEMKVSRSAISNIINGKDQPPRLETLDKLGLYFQLPLWRVIQMAGIELGLPGTPDELARQLTSLGDRIPEIQPIVGYLLKLHPDDLRAVVAYLETLDRLRHNGSGA